MIRQRLYLTLIGLATLWLSAAACGRPATQAAIPSATQAAPAAAPSATSPPAPTARPSPTAVPPTPTAAAALAISSSAFEDGASIPRRYTCDGENLSPPLDWSGVPPAAQSLALVVFDLDAGPALGASVPLGFIHWTLYNIPSSAAGLPEGVPAVETLADGSAQGSNDFAPFDSGLALGYAGPCPPAEHRYVFRLYALDAPLGLPPRASPAEVLQALEGHVLAAAEWTGRHAPP